MFLNRPEEVGPSFYPSPPFKIFHSINFPTNLRDLSSNYRGYRSDWIPSGIARSFPKETHTQS